MGGEPRSQHGRHQPPMIFWFSLGVSWGDGGMGPRMDGHGGGDGDGGWRQGWGWR